MMRIAVVTFAMASVAVCQPAAPPAFDAASIKASAPGRGRGNPMIGADIRTTPGSLTMRRVTLKTCIAWAYHVFEYQVSGSSGSESDRYDIDAKTPGPVAEAGLRAMLQTLLADRFQLALHRQTKETQAYVLSIGKNGPKIHESTTEGEADIQADQKTMSVAIRRVPLAQIIDPLTQMLQMPVVDMTGLTGRYDVTLDIAKYLPQAGERPDPVSLVQTALQEDFGLKLESKKMALDFLVVDHAAKTPTEN